VLRANGIVPQIACVLVTGIADSVFMLSLSVPRSRRKHGKPSGAEN
jgi:hypothetical protein